MLKISEIFISRQGEGPFIGEKSIFIRLFGCNLKCKWCDTKYAIDIQEAIKLSKEPFQIEPNGLYRLIIEILSPNKKIKHIVFTGGEPLLYQNKLLTIAEKLTNQGYIVEIETNGTILPERHISNIYYNVSIKLSNSGNPYKLRINSEAIDYFTKNPKAIFKFVINPYNYDKDLKEILKLKEAFNIQSSKIYLMPLTESVKDPKYKEKERIVENLSKLLNFKYTPRLQIKYGWR